MSPKQIQRSKDFMRMAQKAIETVQITRKPEMGDGVEDWFDERLSAILLAANISTIALLSLCVVQRKLWFKDIAGLGAARAAQIQAFFNEYPTLRELATQTALAPAAMQIRPWESIIVPEHIDGTQGKFRAPAASCSLRANNDHAAIEAWLSLHESPATQRAYKKEAERLILWSIIERGQALSSLTMEDATAYRNFLRNPTPVARWIGPAITRRSAQWRPFTGPLSSGSIGFSLTVLNALFRFLKSKNYVFANPFDGVKAMGDQRAMLNTDRAFSQAQWELIKTIADGLESSYGWRPQSAQRLRMVLDFSYATGLRSHELLGAKLADIEVDGAGNSWIKVVGKGTKAAKVVLPLMARAALERYLVQRGLPVTPSRWDSDTPLIAGVEDAGDSGTKGISGRRLHAIVKDFFETAAGVIEKENPKLAVKLRHATPHWMRHTHATHALAKGVGLTAVRDNLRHASIKTTSLYLHTQDDQRANELAKAFGV